jgi:hypothetical protein
VTLLGTYCFFFVVGLIGGICEWKNMNASSARRVLSIVMFPAFMYTYLPVVAVTLFLPRVEWKQIKHKSAKKIEKT